LLHFFCGILLIIVIKSALSFAANVMEALQSFWKKKLHSDSVGLFSHSNEALICYMVEPATRPPFKCYVTLPNGCCFGNLLSVYVGIDFLYL